MLEAAQICAPFVTLQLIAFALNYGIVWYERTSPEVKRTLINRLNTNKCLISIGYTFLIMNLSMAIILNFDIPTLTCDLVTTVMYAMVHCYFTHASISIVLR